MDDPRAFHRMGITLSQANKYDLHIIGFPTKKLPQYPGITFHPLPQFARISWKRLSTPLLLLKKVAKLKPQLLIVNTHEYLIVSGLIRILFGTRIVYDVRENYFRNLVYTHTYPPLIRQALGGYVRGKEWVSKAWVRHYLLAESGYQREFSFQSPNFTVIQNTFQGEKANFISKNVEERPIEILISGTLAEHYGLFEAINYAIEFSKISPVRLRIIGYCPNKTTLQQLKRQIVKYKDIIILEGGERWVAHERIIEAIQQADIGLVAYPRHPATENCLPTKIFEYMAHQLPFFITPLPHWIDYCERFQAAIPVDFGDLRLETLRNALKTYQNTLFYPSGAPDEAFWTHSDGPKFTQVIDQLVHSK